ncbi:MAG: xanthine dehydrogenase family protein subunit M [Pseudomonadota bacterium]
MHQTLRPFELIEPASLEEAVRWLSSYGENAKVLAGGLDVISKMRRWQIDPKALVSLQEIPGLDTIEADEKGGLRIGALSTLRDIELSPVIKDRYELLHEAVHQIASVQVKTMGTAAGNLCVATPASDLSPPLLALGAELKATGPDGTKTILMENFYRGLEKTALAPAEIVTEIRIPDFPAHSGGAFLKLAHTAACIAKVNVAVLVKSVNGVCDDVRIAMGCVAPTVMRAARAEEMLKGKPLDQAGIAAAAQAAAEEAAPSSDLRSSAEYRRDMVRVLVGRCIEKALQISRGNS